MIDNLLEEGWRVLLIWECTMRGKYRLSEGALLKEMISWLDSDIKFIALQSRKTDEQPNLNCEAMNLMAVVQVIQATQSHHLVF